MLRWLEKVASSSHEKRVFDTISGEMTDYAKTRATKDNDTIFLWSTDVMESDFKFDHETVMFAIDHLLHDGFLKNWLIDGRVSRCYYIPLKSGN